MQKTPYKNLTNFAQKKTLYTEIYTNNIQYFTYIIHMYTNVVGKIWNLPRGKGRQQEKAGQKGAARRDAQGHDEKNEKKERR